MEIIFNEKKTVALGELTATPIFYVDAKSISYWNFPFENEKITENEKSEIIEYITKASQEENQTKIIFD